SADGGDGGDGGDECGCDCSSDDESDYDPTIPYYPKPYEYDGDLSPEANWVLEHDHDEQERLKTIQRQIVQQSMTHTPSIPPVSMGESSDDAYAYDDSA